MYKKEMLEDNDESIGSKRILRDVNVLRWREDEDEERSIIGREMEREEKEEKGKGLKERKKKKMSEEKDNKEKVLIKIERREGKVGWLRISWKIGIKRIGIFKIKKWGSFDILKLIGGKIEDKKRIKKKFEGKGRELRKGRKVKLDRRWRECRRVRKNMVDKRKRK